MFAQGKTDQEVADIVHRVPETTNKMRKELYALFGLEGTGKLKIALLIAKAKKLGFI